jgi:hypothetical protein
VGGQPRLENGEIGGEVLEWWQPTEPQYQAGLWLTNKLVTEQRIGIDRASITRHSDYNSSMKPGGKGWCPGLGFPMPRLLDDLKALSAPPAPTVGGSRQLKAVKVHGGARRNSPLTTITPPRPHSSAQVCT